MTLDCDFVSCNFSDNGLNVDQPIVANCPKVSLVQIPPAAAPMPSQAAEEIQSLPGDPQILLLLSFGEHPENQHHCLVWQQYCPEQEGSSESCMAG